MGRLLICNADDFGIGCKITDTIVDCHINGIISSTTLMANMPSCEYAVQKARQTPMLGVGLHMNITLGRPLTNPEMVPDLIDSQGNFNSSLIQSRKLWRGSKIGKQIELEFRAQIERAMKLGIKPTHCDSHHGVQKRPLARAALIKLCKEYGISAARTHHGLYWTAGNAATSLKIKRFVLNSLALPRVLMRWHNHCILRKNGLRTADRMVAQNLLLPQKDNPKEQLLSLIKALPYGVSEVVFHPGCADDEVKDSPKFSQVRRIDASITSDPDVVAAIRDNNIKLISFRDICS